MINHLRSSIASYWWAFSLTIVLALLLDITGSLHIYGLSRFLGAPLVLGTAVLLSTVAFGWLCSISRPSHVDIDASPHFTQRGVTLLMLLAWLATIRDFRVFIMPDMSIMHVVGFGIGVLLLLIAAIRPPPITWLIWLAVVLGILVRLISFGAIPIEPPRGDMLPLVQGALANFLAGQSPYTIYTMPWELPLTYLPVTWLAYLPAYILGVDIRVTNVVAELIIGAALAWIATSHLKGERTQNYLFGASVGVILWAWVFLQPSLQHWTQATTAPIWWAVLAVTLALVIRGHRWGAAVALGIGAATSPLIAVVSPFVGLYWLRSHGWRQTTKYVVLALAIAAALIVPFLLWSPQQFILGAYRWFNDNSLFPQLRWDMDNTWARQVGFSSIFWRRELEWLLKPIQMTLLLSLFALYWWRGASLTLLAPYITAALLLFTVFNPVLWPYLYTPALITALIAVVWYECLNTAEQASVEP